MGERNAARTENPQGADAQDPFAELTRIIGFDPRVKISKPSRRDAAAANDPPAQPQDSREQAGAAETDRAEGWESEFTDLDFGLGPAEPLPVAGEASSAGNPPGGAASSVEPAGIDEITEAFESEWRKKAAVAPLNHSVSSPAPPDEVSGPAALRRPRPAERPEPGQGDPATVEAELDDILAASIELDLGDDWLRAGEGRGTAGGSSPATPSPKPVVAGGAAEPASATPVQASSPSDMSFENELAALLNAPVSAARQPAKPVPAVAATVQRNDPATGEAQTAAVLPRRTVEAGPSARQKEKLAETAPPRRFGVDGLKDAAAPRATAAEPKRDVNDDPFAALAAMAARYRAAQSASPPKAVSTPGPAIPITAPAAQGVAAPKQAPEVDEMKRPSSVDYETPEINTVDVPEYLTAAADDLDIPADPYGGQDEPRASRPRHDDYDDEFDDLLEEMSTGERGRGMTPAPRAAKPTSAATPRPPALKPAMPRASTIPASARPAAGEPMRRETAVERDWDDYTASARPDTDYGFDESGFDDGDDGRAEASPPQPERKRGKWFAALFGSVALIGGGGAYALKFTGVAEDGGPVLVKADAGPLKVRPENPGGAVVRNQENQVYDRVAGLGGAAVPQEKLLSSAEEPVSLDDPAEEAGDEALAGLEGSGDEPDADLESKGAERVDASVADRTADDDAAIALAPRKVRTVTVNADGSLAETEPATPAVQALASNAADVISAVRKNSEAAGVDATENTASVTPSDDQPAVGTDDAAELAVVQPSGEWTVQIASQPSEAAARSNYADLAKRYSAVLSGRPATIVKADVAGKGTFWRVRVGAEDRSEAASLCSNFKAAGGNCFVTK